MDIFNKTAHSTGKEMSLCRIYPCIPRAVELKNYYAAEKTTGFFTEIEIQSLVQAAEQKCRPFFFFSQIFQSHSTHRNLWSGKRPAVTKVFTKGSKGLGGHGTNRKWYQQKSIM